MQQVHKPGPLKQQNKSHKTGRHRSNRAIQTANKGQVDVKTLTKRKNRSLSRLERINLNKQRQKAKRDEAIADKRSIGVDAAPPILVVVLSYSGMSLDNLLNLIKTCHEEAVVNLDSDGKLRSNVQVF